jgi:nucleotidyltransferase-like protein
MPEAKPAQAPEAEAGYLGELATRLGDLLGHNLVGVYAGGSYALGDYRRESSDLDVAAVVEETLDDELKDAIVARLRHGALPCPARGLELVVYRLETARSDGAEADFELNLNSGAAVRPRIDRDPGSVAAHWFPIDRSILAQAGLTLAGPPAAEVFAGPRSEALLPVLAESVRWHRRDPRGEGAGLANACRALRFASEGRWSSKPAALRWARERDAEPSLEAIEARLLEMCRSLRR